MWPGPYGEFGSRKYLLASLDQSLQRMGLEYVDIFYSHRFDPDTPLQETMGALDTAVRQGKARYVGISSYGPERTEEAALILRELGTPLLIHQPSYSLLNRWIEQELLDVLDREGIGAIVFSPLAQGLLTDKYLHGIPEDSRVQRGNYFSARTDHRGEPRPRPRAQRDRGPARTDARPDGDRLGAARPARDLGAARREQRQPARAERRRPATSRLRARGARARSTATRRRATSTCGPPPAAPDVAAQAPLNLAASSEPPVASPAL